MVTTPRAIVDTLEGERRIEIDDDLSARVHLDSHEHVLMSTDKAIWMPIEHRSRATKLGIWTAPT